MAHGISIKVESPILILLPSSPPIIIFPLPMTCCVGVEMFKKSLDYGQAGDFVGVLLR